MAHCIKRLAKGNKIQSGVASLTLVNLRQADFKVEANVRPKKPSIPA